MSRRPAPPSPPAPSVTSVPRRAFVGGALSTLALGAACRPNAAPESAPKEGDVRRVSDERARAQMPTRKLGKTGLEVSLVGLGGFHIGIQETDAEGVKIVQSAVDRGVTFLDNCWDYNGGKSELRMGKALAEGGRRDKVVLMSKIDGRSKKACLDQIDQSLARLKTDRIDLMQIHEIIRPGDPADCFKDGGCVEGLLEAQKAGKIRFLGFTGHKDPDIHLAMLAEADKHGFAFDAVQMPLNVMDAHYRSFEKKVLPVLVEKGIAVLGMKPMGSGIILEAGVCGPVDCLHYAMSLPTSVVITGCDSMGVLDQAIDAALRFRPLDDAERAKLLGRTKVAAAEGTYEKFKTTQQFDGTEKNKHWLERAEL